MGVKVIAAGMLTTVQDLGRVGYQKYGVSPCGAMDRRSHMMANLLVGNDFAAASLECTVMGPQLLFEEDAVFAVCGADMGPLLDGAAVPLGRAVYAKAGSTLSFGPLRSGCRCYIAVAGGFAADVVMGSASTDQKLGIGGAGGRRLAAGDVLAVGAAGDGASDGAACGGAAAGDGARGSAVCGGVAAGDLAALAGRQLPEEFGGTGSAGASGGTGSAGAPGGAGGSGDGAAVVRVVAGPQYEVFTAKGRDTFFGTEYTVSAESNRMGIRLTGEVIEQEGNGNIISDGIAAGAVQVPASGMPIVMMADRQTTGGYAKIATVISTDLGRLAQCVPGSKVRFEEVSVARAQEILLEERRALQELRARLDEAGSAEAGVEIGRAGASVETDGVGAGSGFPGAGCGRGHKYEIRVNGKTYHVEVEPAGER